MAFPYGPGCTLNLLQQKNLGDAKKVWVLQKDIAAIPNALRERGVLLNIIVEDSRTYLNQKTPFLRIGQAL